MADNEEAQNNNVFSSNDTLDINELASLNEDISEDFIEQLQNQISSNAQLKNDGDLFEEVSKNDEPSASFNDNIDDNFIKKYKAKLKKQQNNYDTEQDEYSLKERSSKENNEEVPDADKQINTDTTTVDNETKDDVIAERPELQEETAAINTSEIEPINENAAPDKDNIETISGGNIVEKPINADTMRQDESLNYLDNNVNYSKYVIYIDPENKDFIDSLTVKERKNLINRIIREQDAIALTKNRLNKLQMIITHLIIAIITITISVPCIYWLVNASLEATINNYRASKSNFGQLYREHGKIKTKQPTIK